jgi:hypothetical protein
MAIQQNITAADGWFTGEDKTLEFEVLEPDGATPEDVTGWALEWQLRPVANAADPPTLSKVPTIIGTYNAVRATNTQRVEVTIAASDTAALTARTYQHALKRTDAGSETVLSYGSALLQTAATH